MTAVVLNGTYGRDRYPTGDGGWHGKVEEPVRGKMLSEQAPLLP